MRWKAQTETDKHQREQVENNLKKAREKLEMEMKAACREHKLMRMREELMRLEEDLRTMEELDNQRVQNRQLRAVRQELERRRHEGMMTRQHERAMRDFSGARDRLHMRMGQMGMAGRDDRGTLGAPSVPAGPPPTPGPGTTTPERAMEMPEDKE
ncbi:non-POU domain-containing octamer-binding protein-like [Rhineura floridana]|uniref:non-POU domain-containing octamer-binding protein-like n=1 Tax=Rhineura floridana TaxID=261503 RepID=UPI002AC8296B|nr:non-POU domain-containing octamer-binding protein-like [Rhineura floridana]